MTANKLSKLFLKWFQEQNPEAKIYRNNSGTIRRKNQMIHFGTPNKGGADFIAFVSIRTGDINNDYLSVEFYKIKTAKDKMLKEQIKFANMITNMGGEYFIVHELKLNEIEKDHLVIRECDKHLIIKDFYIEKWSVK